MVSLTSKASGVSRSLCEKCSRKLEALFPAPAGPLFDHHSGWLDQLDLLHEDLLHEDFVRSAVASLTAVATASQPAQVQVDLAHGAATPPVQVAFVQVAWVQVALVQVALVQVALVQVARVGSRPAAASASATVVFCATPWLAPAPGLALIAFVTSNSRVLSAPALVLPTMI